MITTGEFMKKTEKDENVHEDLSTEATQELPDSLELCDRRPWDVRILTLTPTIFPGPLQHSVIGKAMTDQKWKLTVADIHNYPADKHGTVDDPPYGGGGGMVLRPDVASQAIEDHFVLGDEKMPIVYLSPRGKLFNQQMATELANLKGIQLLCGRFEGVDERIIEKYDIIEISIGDYVLSCGDLAAYVLLDTCIRLLPGVIDQNNSLAEESFAAGTLYANLLEYPHYTRPAEWSGMVVPSVLLSGHHGNITIWRLEQAKNKTKKLRPDLWYKSFNKT